jgi:hypothetical protein
LPERRDDPDSGAGLPPETGAAPSPDFLDRLHHNLLRGLAEFAGMPLRRPATTVRGIVRRDAGHTRIFLLPDSDFAASCAVDVPLLDAHGDQHNHVQVAALLRAIAGGDQLGDLPTTVTTVGSTRVTVHDGSAVLGSVAAADTVQDHVRASLLGLVGSGPSTNRAGGRGPDFTGFLVLDEARVRYYFDTPDGPIGVDCGRGSGSTFLAVRIKELFDTGVMPSRLVPDARDEYCRSVYDLTG